MYINTIVIVVVIIVRFIYWVLSFEMVWLRESCVDCSSSGLWILSYLIGVRLAITRMDFLYSCCTILGGNREWSCQEIIIILML